MSPVRAVYRCTTARRADPSPRPSPTRRGEPESEAERKALFADEGCARQTRNTGVEPADADAANDRGDQVADDEGHPVHRGCAKEDADDIRAEGALRVQ